MEDHELINLFWDRREEAIPATADRYGRYCFSIADHILSSREDSEECVNDTWLRTWYAIPPSRPSRFAAFLGKITRNLAFDRYRGRRRQKRGGGEMALALDELAECIPSPHTPEQAVEEAELVRQLDLFLEELSERDRFIFLRRYWYVDPLADIARRLALHESTVKSSLFRSRKKLREALEKEGIVL
ncbi:MAG: sigma-70 family RNA polymerase sigma factor [Lachnospiraceae bacterium]|nr:sigma-70 family RNA polymerase sigma factor [Lachnospiraceae bacterium]